jgi:hypothetical protein
VDPIGILLFSERPVIVAPVTADRAAAHEAVTSIASTTAQGTALFDAVVSGRRCSTTIQRSSTT